MRWERKWERVPLCIARNCSGPLTTAPPELGKRGELQVVVSVLHSWGSRGRRFKSGRQRLVLGNNSRRGAAPASGYHFVPPGSSPPCDVDRTGLPMLIATADGQYADLPNWWPFSRSCDCHRR